jgi:hypothetical protein
MVTEEYCRAMTQAVGEVVNADVDLVPVCWNFDFSWNPLTLFILNFDLRKIRLESYVPERNYCVDRGVAVFCARILERDIGLIKDLKKSSRHTLKPQLRLVRTIPLLERWKTDLINAVDRFNFC